MRALVVAPQPFFSPRGTPFSVYYRTLVTAELGVQVDLLTYGEGQDVDIPGVRIIRIPRFGFLGHVKTGPSVLKLFLDVFLVSWMIALLLRHRYHFVHAHEEAVFFCRFLKPIFRYKLVYDMHSSLPQQLTNFKFTTSKALIGMFEWLENSSLRAADAVITICPALADYALGVLRDSSKHFLIENSLFDSVRFASNGQSHSATPISVAETAQSGNGFVPAGRPLIVYAGTLEPYQGIDLLLDAFRELRVRVPDAFLLIVGGTPDQVARYQAHATAAGVAGDCRFTGRVSQQEAKGYAAKATVLVSPRTEGNNTPLKVYEQLASGIPLVATNIYSHTQVLTPEVAFLADPTPEEYGRALAAALTEEEARVAKCRAAQALYERQYSRAAYVGKMRQLFATLGLCVA